jgi:hypothetical protein
MNLLSYASAMRHNVVLHHVEVIILVDGGSSAEKSCYFEKMHRLLHVIMLYFTLFCNCCQNDKDALLCDGSLIFMHTYESCAHGCKSSYIIVYLDVVDISGTYFKKK